MKNENASHSKKLDALIKNIRKEYKDIEVPAFDPIVQLIIGFLQWNATSKNALEAFDKIMAQVVDLNDLRVSYPKQIIEIIGKKYSQADERVTRMRETLFEIFDRERSVSLQSLVGKPKKQIKTYLETLPGIPSYVSAQVTLLCFQGHAMPVDDSLHYLLAAEDAIDPGATVKEVSSWLERQIRADDAITTHLAFQAWVEANWRRVAASRSRKPAKKTAKKTTKKVNSKAKTETKNTTKKKNDIKDPKTTKTSKTINKTTSKKKTKIK